VWDHEGFGKDWDKGGVVAEREIAGPLGEFIVGELRAHGIDPDRRAEAAPDSVDAFARAVAGGPARVLAELVGYAASAAQAGAAGHGPEQDLDEALAVAVAGIATEILRTRVDKVTWDDICFEVRETLDVYEISGITAEEAAHVVGDAIGRVNYNCVNQWKMVHETARREAGLRTESD